MIPSSPPVQVDGTREQAGQRERSTRQDVWMRWMLFWHGLFYVSLVVATGMSLTLDHFSWWEIALLVSLSLLLGTWYAACIVILPRSWQQRRWLTLGYLSIGWLIWSVLIAWDPIYLFVLTGLYPQTFVLLLAPWNLIGGFLLLLISLLRQRVWSGWNASSLFTLGIGLTGMLMGIFIHTVLRQSRERKHLIEELEATRQELAQAARQTGIMQERQRLAGEIHDTFTQGFSSIVMSIEALDTSLPGEQIKPSLDWICRIARENLTEARRLLWALQPETLERATLPEVVASLAQRWAEESNIEAKAIVTGIMYPLRPEIEVTILRAAQEALANVRKHAQADTVILTLSYLGDSVVLDVQDDGIGFDPCLIPASPIDQVTGSFGLKVLRERVGQLGGMLTVESASGEGTTVAVALPAIIQQVSLLESHHVREGVS